MAVKKVDNPMIIPFGKAVRVGNYKVWRSRSREMEQVNVSNLDGTWTVKIPQSAAMFGTITQAFVTTDENLRDQFLGMIFTNMQNVCLVNSESLHDAFFFLTEMMSFPYLLLPEKEMEKRMADGMKALGVEKKAIKEHIAKMVTYRRSLYELIELKKKRFIEEYERQQSERRSGEDEELKRLEQDEIAGQALDILNEKGGD